MVQKRAQVSESWPALGTLHFRSTAKVRQVLKAALRSDCLTCDERALAEKYTDTNDGEPIPYKLLRSASTKSRTAGESTAWLHQALRGSELILPKPSPREKSAELQARLARLQEGLERKQYAELVEDVTRRERRERERGYMATYRDQLGFGLHVLAIMFTGYFAGHYAFQRLWPHQPALHAAGGVLGLIGGMLVEALLFIIRAARFDEEDEKRSAAGGTSNIGGYAGPGRRKDPAGMQLPPQAIDSGGSGSTAGSSHSQFHQRRRRML